MMVRNMSVVVMLAVAVGVVHGGEVKAATRGEHAELMMQLGMLFQFGALLDSMSVYENVSFALRHVRRMPEDQIRQIVRENLLMVGLKEVEALP